MYGIGIEDLLNSITTFIEIPLLQENDLSAYVYKIEHNKKEQKRAFLKVIGGSLKTRKSYTLNGLEENLKIRSLKTFCAGNEIDADEVSTNDIAIIDHAESLMVGDYLGTKPSLFSKLNIPSPALKSSIHPVKVEDRSKLISAMNVLSVEDPSLAFSINADNNELEVSLYGATQREVILTLLEERFSVDAYFEEVKTIYKERLKTKSEYTIHIEVPPNPYWASIGLIIEPLPIGAGLVMESEISLGYLNRSFQNAVFDGVKKACESGLYGWEVTDLKVTFSHGIYYSPVSTPADFRSLAPYVFRLALQQADVELLEPILDFKLQIPLAVNARAITDINKMQGEIYTITSDGDWTTILGNIPLDTSKEYSAEVSSYTQGLGVFVTRFSGYRPTNKKVSRSVELNEKDKLMYMFEKELG
jgi:ribosomal protection tetracycline resistance protein